MVTGMELGTGFGMVNGLELGTGFGTVTEVGLGTDKGKPVSGLMITGGVG
jgi:hypothetical protein